MFVGLFTFLSDTSLGNSVGINHILSTMEFEDDYYYKHYGFEYYREHLGPPLIKKRSRLIAAVVQNQPEVLKDLLDSPKWYNVVDHDGCSLLQIAVLRENVEVFNYLMSIPKFPLEHQNKQQQTALVMTFRFHMRVREYFAYELIKKGACIDGCSYQGNMPIHLAVMSMPKVAELLIEKGVDVNLCNNDGVTPLDFATHSCYELIPMLLMAGAEPSVPYFEALVFQYNRDFEKEIVFLYLFDELSNPVLRVDCIVKLAETHPWLLYDLIRFSVRATVDDDNLRLSDFFTNLCKLPIKELSLILENFSSSLIEIFSVPARLEPIWENEVSLENFSLMLHSSIGPTLINFMSNLVSSMICQCSCIMESYEKFYTQRYCFLLSYNMKITEFDVMKIYEFYGYCELFRILLHMDIEKFEWKKPLPNFLPVLVFNIHMDLEDFFRKIWRYSEKSVDDLVNFFVHPQLTHLYLRRVKYRGVPKKENLPTIPLLVEMARNEFRKFFVRKFEMKTAKEFYSRLNGLPITDFHKRIISFEVKLY